MDLMKFNEAAEDVIEDEDYADDTAFDSERCALCSDDVIDRGVIDCCSHWFCFACIDKWAAITSLCPICKSEFQLITCIPVYDTIGNNKIEEHPFPRDDDWRVQGNNNTLSFPSYYIDEDAVVCLDGDECKIRNGLATSEEDLTFDTSIACDSCDTWYHAFCVEFNPGLTNENSWLCPRCITNGVQQKSDEALMHNLSKQSSLTNAIIEWGIDASFSQKVSVSVADAGETALVVSLVEGKPMIADNKSSSDMLLDFDIQDKTEASTPDAVDDNVNGSVQPEKRNCIAENSEMLLETSSEMAACEIEVDGKGNLFALRSLQDTESVTDLHPPYRGKTEILDCMPLALAIVADPVVYSSENKKMYPCDFEWSDLICNDEKAPTGTFAQHINTKLYTDISPQRDDIQTDVNLEGNSFTRQSLQQSSYKMSTSDKDVTETSSPLLSSLVMHGDSRGNTIEGSNGNPCDLDDHRTSCFLSSKAFTNMNEPSEDGSLTYPSRNILGVSSHSVDKEVGDTTKNNMVRANNVCSSHLSSLPEDKMVTIAREEMIAFKDLENIDVDRKPSEKFQSCAIDVDYLNKHSRKREKALKVELVDDYPAKKLKSENNSKMSPSGYERNSFHNEKSQSSNGTAASLKTVNPTYGPLKQECSPDIMSIVKETNHRSSVSNSGGIDNRTNVAGLRVKKIMRRSGDRTESSTLVQMLRKEIREAVQDKTSKNFGKDSTFDAKLLTAFRAALVKPKSDLSNKVDSSLIRARKPLLQKGRVRENLTKKIYASSTGRRKRAWDRDREIEFWKHRCERMKPEKVETLQSVLHYLKSALNSCSENTKLDQGPEEDTKNSILSRVYLADASVFPRKDDIKPLSALAGCSLGDNPENKNVNIPISLAGKAVKKPSTLREALTSKVNGSSGSKGREHDLKESAYQSNAPPSDKRKWAMEVLARKNALMNSNASKEKQEDSDALKGNYPLLAQLPHDMRPVLAPSRHSKVPLSVRQAQLFRIVEHYLRRANLPVMRKTAVTELAVADAVNVERDTYERSNSKLVYMNLCSQFISQLDKQPQTAQSSSLVKSSAGTDQAGKGTSPKPEANGCGKVEQALKSISPPKSPNSLHRIVESSSEEEATSSKLSTTGLSKVEEALKLAGLSDSPPNSPYRIVEDNVVQDQTSIDATGEAFESVLDIVTHPELDIYGDFEYDLEDDVQMAPSTVASAFGVSNVQPEIRDSRMKVVLSTLKYDPPKPQNFEAVDVSDNQREIGMPSKPSTSVECKTRCTADAAENVTSSDPFLLETSHKETLAELSLTECEELYGPEKEPLVNRVSGFELIGGTSNTDMEAGNDKAENGKSNDGTAKSEFQAEGCAENSVCSVTPLSQEPHGGRGKNISKDEGAKIIIDDTSISSHFISKKVEVYVKEHIRPLCKSGVISSDQYRWAVRKTTEKVMKYHHKDKNANFLIKEGDKVKKLAEQYVEASQQKAD